MLITQKETKILIEAGVFYRVHLVQGLDRSWEIVFEKKLGESCQLKTSRGQVRSFPTVESALRVLEQLGVKPKSLEFSF